MSKEPIKYPGLLNKLWYDPIWSKVIYAGIIAIIGLIGSFFVTIFKEISFKDVVYNTLTFDIPLWAVLVILFSSLLVYGIIYKIRKRKKSKSGVFDVEIQIGHFSFRELYNALLTNKVDTPFNLMRPGMDANIDLLTLLILYQRQLNLGANWQHDTFTYYTLAPMLMSYGLTEKYPTTDTDDSVGMDMIQLSENGIKFLSYLEKYRVYRDEEIEDDISLTDTISKETSN